MPPGLDKGFQLGPWRVEPLRGELSGAYGARHLEPKAMDVLVCLAERAGELVTRDELLRAVWGARAVTDEPLTKAISALRQALGDSSDAPSYIETVPKRGYRLLQDVIADQPLANSRPLAAHPVIISAVAVAIVAALLLYLNVGRQFASDAPVPVAVQASSVAVLPFENLSSDPDDAYFAAGIHDELISRLANISALRVIARPTMLRYGGTALSLAEIADELNVDAVMDGSVRYEGDRARITARLVDPETDDHLWMQTYERDRREIFAVQVDVASNVAAALEAELLPAERARVGRALTDSPVAHALFFKANEASARGDIAGKLNYLSEAIAVDPGFATAYARRALTSAQWPLAGAGPAPGRAGWEAWRNRVQQDAQIALELDPDQASPHLARAILDATFWRWQEARSGFECALRRWPDESLLHYAVYAFAWDDYAGAIRAGERAVDLDPKNPAAYVSLGYAYIAAQDWDGVAAAMSAAVELRPNSMNAHRLLAVVEAGRGNSQKALEILDLLERLDADHVLQAYRLATRARIFAMSGAADRAEEYFHRLVARSETNPVGEADWVNAYLAIGDAERALEWLQRAADRIEAGEPNLAFTALLHLAKNVLRDPILDSPHFVAVRERILPKFDQYRSLSTDRTGCESFLSRHQGQGAPTSVSGR